MSLSAAVEVAVGLVFAYFVFSSICSGVNEGIARFLNLRGTALFKSINALIGDAELAKAFWDHPMIAGLSKSRSKAAAQEPAQASLAGAIKASDATTGTQKTTTASLATATDTPESTITSQVGKDLRKVLPSYISPTTAITAMLDVARAAEAAAAEDKAAEDKAAEDKAAEDKAAATEGTEATAATEATPATATATETEPSPPAPGFASILTAVQNTAVADEQRIQADLEKWFNDAMDRLSGWYKRYVQAVLLGLAIIVTVAFNVNTIHIAQDLWSQPALQAVVGQQANQATSAQQNQGQSGHEALGTAVAQAETLPIGWGSANQPHGTEWWLTILGWLLTIGALTFGAPFWFDLLTRMNSLRSTGPPPKTA